MLKFGNFLSNITKIFQEVVKYFGKLLIFETTNLNFFKRYNLLNFKHFIFTFQGFCSFFIIISSAFWFNSSSFEHFQYHVTNVLQLFYNRILMILLLFYRQSLNIYYLWKFYNFLISHFEYFVYFLKAILNILSFCIIKFWQFKHFLIVCSFSS